MKFPFDIDGYAQGHRFSDDPDFYDSVNQRFTDLAGGDRFQNYVSKIVGTPVFANVGLNSRRGLYLDNTNQWQFPHACPWQGSGLVVMQLSIPAVNANYAYIHLFGEDTVTVTNNPYVRVYYNTGLRYVGISGGASAATQNISGLTDGAIAIVTWSRNQQDRIFRCTLDGVTVTASAAYNTASTNGEYIGMRGTPRCRIGNLDGTGGTTASTGVTAHILEQHFWDGDILSSHLSEVGEMYSTLKAYYGI